MLVQLFNPLRPGLMNVSLFQLEKLALAEHIVNRYHHFTSTIQIFCQEFQVQGPACVGSDKRLSCSMTLKDGVHVFPKQVTEVSYSLCEGKKADDFLQGQDMFITHSLPPDVKIMAYHIPLFTSIYWSLG